MLVGTSHLMHTFFAHNSRRSTPAISKLFICLQKELNLRCLDSYERALQTLKAVSKYKEEEPNKRKNQNGKHDCLHWQIQDLINSNRDDALFLHPHEIHELYCMATPLPHHPKEVLESQKLLRDYLEKMLQKPTSCTFR